MSAASTTHSPADGDRLGRRGTLVPRDSQPHHALVGAEVEYNERPKRAPPKSWWWTLSKRRGFVVCMDEHDAELVSGLCTRIGMIMEDVVDTALTIRSMDLEKRRDAIAEIAEASATISALISAVQALHQS